MIIKKIKRKRNNLLLEENKRLKGILNEKENLLNKTKEKKKMKNNFSNWRFKMNLSDSIIIIKNLIRKINNRNFI